jgi:hypothetical protein
VNEDVMGEIFHAHEREEKYLQHSDRNPWKKLLLGRYGPQCEDNIKMDLKEIGRSVWSGLI